MSTPKLTDRLTAKEKAAFSFAVLTRKRDSFDTVSALFRYCFTGASRLATISGMVSQPILLQHFGQLTSFRALHSESNQDLPAAGFAPHKAAACQLYVPSSLSTT